MNYRYIIRKVYDRGIIGFSETLDFAKTMALAYAQSFKSAAEVVYSISDEKNICMANCVNEGEPWLVNWQRKK